MGGDICYDCHNPLGTPPNWVLRTAIGPARCCARQLSPPVWRGSLALRSSRAQHLAEGRCVEQTALRPQGIDPAGEIQGLQVPLEDLTIVTNQAHHTCHEVVAQA